MIKNTQNCELFKMVRTHYMLLSGYLIETNNILNKMISGRNISCNEENLKKLFYQKKENDQIIKNIHNIQDKFKCCKKCEHGKF